MYRLVRNSPHRRNLIKPEPWCLRLEVRVVTEEAGFTNDGIGADLSLNTSDKTILIFFAEMGGMVEMREMAEMGEGVGQETAGGERVADVRRQKQKLGRPERTEPYKIMELPTSNSNVTEAELREVKRQRALDQNNVRSQKYRQKKRLECGDAEELVKRLEKRQEELKMLELARMEKIRRIKQFYKDQIGAKCGLCTQVLHTVVSQPTPMVTIKEECMINLDLVKTEPP